MLVMLKHMTPNSMSKKRPAEPSNSAENANWRTSECKPRILEFMPLSFWGIWRLQGTKYLNSDCWDLLSILRSKMKFCTSRVHLKLGWTYLSAAWWWTMINILQCCSQKDSKFDQGTKYNPTGRTAALWQWARSIGEAHLWQRIVVPSCAICSDGQTQNIAAST